MDSRSLSLEVLLATLNETGLLIERVGDDGIDVSMHHLAFDSREVQTGGCFVAIRGHKTDGHLFFDQAVLNGARVIIMESMPETELSVSGITLLRVNNSARAMSIAAQAYYNWPARKLKMIGVTGTNGKTTVTTLLSQLLSANDLQNALIGTIATTINEKRERSSMTTPDSMKVNRVLAEAVSSKCTHAILEVSSHALEQDRLWGIDFDIAVFTNLSRDHLDYHQTFEKYLASKRILFESLGPDAIAIVNTHDPNSEKITRECKAEIWESDNELSNIDLGKSKLSGRFNAYNLASVFLVGRAIGIDDEATIDFLHRVEPVPGRFEQITGKDGLRIVIDYAHTPDALENALSTGREVIERGNLIVVFGCGGDRDKGKRPLMGEVANRLADKIYLTSDNPRSEDPSEIIEEVLQGIRSETSIDSADDGVEFKKEGTRIHVISDRKMAIQIAIRDAESEDLILVAGKGHETYQILKNETIDFDDKTISQDALALR